MARDTIERLRQAQAIPGEQLFEFALRYTINILFWSKLSKGTKIDQRQLE